MFKNLFKRSPKYAVRVLGTPDERYIMKGNSVRLFPSREEAEVMSKAFAGSTVVVEYKAK